MTQASHGMTGTTMPDSTEPFIANRASLIALGVALCLGILGAVVAFFAFRHQSVEAMIGEATALTAGIAGLMGLVQSISFRQRSIANARLLADELLQRARMMHAQPRDADAPVDHIPSVEAMLALEDALIGGGAPEAAIELQRARHELDHAVRTRPDI